MVVSLPSLLRINWHIGSRLQSCTQRIVARQFRAPTEAAREHGCQVVRPETRPHRRPGQQSRRVRHPWPRFGTLPGDRARRRPNVTAGDENNVLLVRRGSDVPEPLSVRYNGMMWGKDPPADVRLTRFAAIYVARSGAGDVCHRFDECALHYVPANWGLYGAVTPGATTVNPGGAAAASH
jgi:hypothetical protein